MRSILLNALFQPCYKYFDGRVYHLGGQLKLLKDQSFVITASVFDFTLNLTNKYTKINQVLRCLIYKFIYPVHFKHY